MITLKNKIFDTKIMRYETDGFKITPNIDFSVGYNLIYLIKKNKNDADTDAVKAITPVFVTEKSLNKIIINFTPDSLVGLDCSIYYHSLKAISNDKSIAITLFKGTLKIEGDYIKAPIDEV